MGLGKFMNVTSYLLTRDSGSHESFFMNHEKLGFCNGPKLAAAFRDFYYFGADIRRRKSGVSPAI